MITSHITKAGFSPRLFWKVTRVKLICAIWLFSSLGGCSTTDPTQGYSSRSLYQSDIKTVHVKMFESKSFRRGIEFELTAPLVTQIELKTPYKVIADSSKADTVLYGTITNVHERILTQQRDLDRPLESQVVITANVTWKDLRDGRLIIDNKPFRLSGDYAHLLAAGRDSASKEAANKLAMRIVEAMELPW
ncbi:MAG: hypothetical protein K9M57_01365 [Phycisphaerae bacterium]|nr:hypothetical protein [Phycisphaerae bacterium]